MVSNVAQSRVFLELGALARLATMPGAIAVTSCPAVQPQATAEALSARRDQNMCAIYVRSEREIAEASRWNPFHSLRHLESFKNAARRGGFAINSPVVPSAIVEVMKESAKWYLGFAAALLCYYSVELNKIQSGVSLSREERLFLRNSAQSALALYDKDRDLSLNVDCNSLFRALMELKDFESLRGFLKHDGFRFQVLVLFENYEEFLESAKSRYYYGIDILFRESYPLVNKLLQEKALQCEARKDQMVRTFDLFRTALAVASLSPSYDVCVALARGGLFAGTVAELLGLKVITLQVAAHDKKKPWARFIGEMHPEDIRGKRVLILEDDTVSGASIKEAVRALKPFGPATMGVFFNHDPGYLHSTGLEITRGFGLAVHHAGNITYAPGLPIFYRLHETLNTPLGRLKKIEREFKEVLDAPAHTRPDVAAVLKTYIDEQERLYFALNHFLPGMEKVRKSIVTNLEAVLKQYLDAQKLTDMFPSSLDSIAGLITSKSLLPVDFAEHLARGRYQEQAEKRVAALKVSGIRFPHSYTAAFRAAKAALKGNYDVALIVGPEGFAYEPIFKDLGISTVAINIPEDSFGGARTMAAFDDLAALQGKRVLVVEDDVQSGATLKKILVETALHAPKSWGLYLGLASQYQQKDNIPPAFRKVYVADADDAKNDAAFLAHLKKRESFFKKKFTPSVSRRPAHR